MPGRTFENVLTKYRRASLAGPHHATVTQDHKGLCIVSEQCPLRYLRCVCDNTRYVWEYAHYHQTLVGIPRSHFRITARLLTYIDYLHHLDI